MPVKGLGLIFRSYSDISGRFTSDIDILIKPEDIVKAGEVLKKNGFIPAETNRNNLWHVQFIDENGIEVELHYNIPRVRSSLNIMEIFTNSRLHTIDGRNVIVPSSEDLLIFQACSSGLTNALGQGSLIKTCVDYMVTIEKEEKNWSWERFYERSERAGARNHVLFILLFLNDIFQWGDNSGENKFQEKLKSFMLNSHIRGYNVPAWFIKDGDICFDRHVSSLYNFLISGDIKRFLRHLKYALFPGKERVAERYGISPDSMKVYFYYPLRIFELLKSKSALRSILNTFRVARFLGGR